VHLASSVDNDVYLYCTLDSGYALWRACIAIDDSLHGVCSPGIETHLTWIVC